MVGHELQSENISLHNRRHFSEHLVTMKLYNRDETIRLVIDTVQKHIENHSPDNSSSDMRKAWDSETLRQSLSKISSDLLGRSPSESAYVPTTREIKDLEHDYKNVMEMFLWKTDNFLGSIKELRKILKKTVKQFHAISRLTAQATLVSCLTEVVLLAGVAMHRVFNFNWNPNLPIISTVAGTVGIMGSVAALSFMKQSAAEIIRDVKDRSVSFVDLAIAHRKGNWIDEEILRLFPHRIDLNFFVENGSEDKSIFHDKMSWRLYLCSVILLSNIQKDAALLKDEAFLSKVKVFVESQAAEIWWHRIKIKKLLDALLKKMETISTRDFMADHQVHLNRTALYLYPLLIPWLVNSWKWNGVRFVCSSIAAAMAYNDLASQETEEFEELKKISKNFQKDFKDIAEICRTLDNDYD